MAKVNFYLWPGCGYALDGPFTIESDLINKNNYIELGLELLTAQLINSGATAYYMTEEENAETCARLGIEPDSDTGTLEGYLYIDATMNGAPYPVYLNIENLKADFIE